MRDSAVNVFGVVVVSLFCLAVLAAAVGLGVQIRRGGGVVQSRSLLPWVPLWVLIASAAWAFAFPAVWWIGLILLLAGMIGWVAMVRDSRTR